MKKSYIEPTIEVTSIRIENVMQNTSITVNGTTNSGEADARQGGSTWDDED